MAGAGKRAYPLDVPSANRQTTNPLTLLSRNVRTPARTKQFDLSKNHKTSINNPWTASQGFVFFAFYCFVAGLFGIGVKGGKATGRVPSR